jgi:chemotaxis protein MotA
MRTLPLGFILTAVIVYLSLGKESLALYANYHALIIVVGGTVTILLMSSPAEALRRLVTATGDLFKASQKLEHFRAEFQELTQHRSLSTKSKNELINYSVELWASGVEAELFIVLVSQRREELERGYIEAVQTLRNLAKYPPALGMTGTVMGLVSLFSVLGTNQAGLGPALALAMTATFLGLIVANCVVTPLADHLHIKHMQNERLYTGIFQILILINRGEASALIKDEVESRAA